MGGPRLDLETAYQAIRHCIGEIRSPYNDGFSSAYCKLELYQLKCWLEDEYASLPQLGDEENWEKMRMMEVLRKP